MLLCALRKDKTKQTKRSQETTRHGNDKSCKRRPANEARFNVPCVMARFKIDKTRSRLVPCLLSFYLFFCLLPCLLSAKDTAADKRRDRRTKDTAPDEIEGQKTQEEIEGRRLHDLSFPCLVVS